MSARQTEAGRSIVKDLAKRHPKVSAPRVALDRFDLARAKKQLANLQKARSTPERKRRQNRVRRSQPLLNPLLKPATTPDRPMITPVDAPHHNPLQHRPCKHFD
jgi:hypothetical protein